MKRKIRKILGVTLTMVMVLTLAVAFSAPVMAAEEEWDLFDVPAAAAAGDWFMDTTIAGFGAFAKATDGTLYLYMDNAAVGPNIIDDLYISTDEGRTWAATDYKADLFLGGSVVTDPIVDMAISSEDADVLYVATTTNVYKTEDAGDSWSDLGAPGGVAITCLDVGYADEEPHIFVGQSIGAGTGEVWYYFDAPFASVWTDLDVCAPDGAPAVGPNLYDVYGIACSPDFDSDALVVAVIVDPGADSWVVANVGAGIGVTGWDDLELLDDVPASYAITGATDPVFVEDFEIDDAYELFVGVSGPAHTLTDGGVYRITGMTDADDFLLSDVDDDIVSLDVVGDLAATSLLAGAITTALPAGITSSPVWYSTDDGDSWDETDKAPTGAATVGLTTANYVIVDDDFADSGIAWCASDAVTEGAVSLTTDFGATWNGISMIDTDMATAVNDIAFSPAYGTGDAPMFMVTTATVAALPSVWKYDGTNWERVWLDAVNALDMVEVSPEYANDTAVFVADSAGVILYSHDGGAEFTAMIRQPLAAITSWAVIDDETIITGAAGGVTYMTTRYGRRVWDEPTMPAAAGVITDLAVLGDTILAGDDVSQVFISFDSGDEFEEVSASDIAGFVATAAGNDTYVAFDPGYASNNFIYAASDDVIARCEIDESEDMGDLEFTDFDTAGTPPVLTPAAFNGPSGIVVSDDGTQVGESVATLYVSDAAPAGGMWRCLNPADSIADVVFEQVDAGIAATLVDFTPVVAPIRNLELSPGNILYSIASTPAAGTAIPDVIYTYEDTLAKPVELSLPANGAALEDTDRVSFGWEDLNADTVNVYEIWVNEEEDFSTATDEIVGTTTQAGVALAGVATSAYTDDSELIWRAADPGTEYFWKVRVGAFDTVAAAGGPVLSRWSDARSFMTKVGQTAAPVEVRPLPGAQDIILTPSFSWLAVDGADLYEIEVTTDAGFASVVTSATALINAWATDVELDYSTVYYWRVRGISASGAPAGDWVISVFTTLEKATVTPPVEVTTVPAPTVEITKTEITPAWIWAIIAIGAVLCIAVIVLIVRTRRVV